jgi:hypothetical protein
LSNTKYSSFDNVHRNVGTLPERYVWWKLNLFSLLKALSADGSDPVRQ